MGQALLEGPDHAASARALERLCPADIVDLAPGRQRYTQFLNADGGIVDDLMVDAAGRRGRAPVPCRQRRAQGGGFRRCCAPSCPPTCGLTVLDDLALDRPAGTAGGERARAPRAGRECRDDAVHERAAASPVDGVDATCLALRLHRRGRLRDFARRRMTPKRSRGACWPSRRSSRSASARAIRCGSRPASASTATNSTRRPIRSRRASPGRSRSGGAIEGGFPGAERIQAALAERPAPQARRHQAGGPRAGARGRRDRRRRRAPSSAPSRRAASARASERRSPWAMSRANHAAPGTPIGLIVRGKTLPRQRRRPALPSARLLSRPIAARSRGDRSMSHAAFHQGPRIYRRRRRCRHGRHHRTCAVATRRRRVRRTARRSATRSPRARRPPSSRASRRRAKCSRRSRGEVVAVNGAARRRAEPHQRGRAWARAGSFKIKLSDPRELDDLMDEAAYQEFLKTIA